MGQQYYYPLLFPTPLTQLSDISLHLDTKRPTTTTSSSHSNTTLYSAIATDGNYVYIWDSSSNMIVKVGTGRGGTVAGQVINIVKQVEALESTKVSQSVS